MRMLIIFTLLLALVLIAGCTGTEIPGIKLNLETSNEGVYDALAISDIQTIPKSPMLPESDVQLSFVLENKDKERPIEVTKIELFDHPLFNCDSDCKPEDINLPLTILPREQKFIVIILKAPDEMQIGTLNTKTIMSFKVDYTFKTITTFTVPVVNMEEIKNRQKSGTTTTLNTVKTIGSGPLEVDAELVGSQFIINNQKSAIIFKIRNKGSGNLPKGMIDVSDGKYSFIISEERGLNIVEPEGGLFDLMLKLKKPLSIYEKESIPLRFDIDPVDYLNDVNIPFKSFTIKADLKYEYELRDSIQLEVKPLRS